MISLSISTSMVLLSSDIEIELSMLATETLVISQIDRIVVVLRPANIIVRMNIVTIKTAIISRRR
jgi:hypothetical protein